MGAAEKLTRQAQGAFGSTVQAAAMVVPPGATLYKSYSPTSKVLGGAGALGAALASKLGDQGSGRSSSVPRQQGVLVLSPDQIRYCKKKTFGVGVGDEIVSWSRDELTIEFVEPMKGGYPGLELTFDDDTKCVVFGEERWGLDALAAAAERS